MLVRSTRAVIKCLERTHASLVQSFNSTATPPTFGFQHSPLRRGYSAGLGGDLVGSTEKLVSSLPEVRLADEAMNNGKFASAKVNLSRAMDIADLMPDKNFRLSIYLRSAKLAQLTGRHDEEAILLDSVIKLLVDISPFPRMPLARSASMAASLGFGPRGTAWAARGATLGYDEHSIFSQWNAILCTRIVALLKDSRVEAALQTIDVLVPEFIATENWHGLYCLHALRGVAHLIKIGNFPVPVAGSSQGETSSSDSELESEDSVEARPIPESLLRKPEGETFENKQQFAAKFLPFVDLVSAYKVSHVDAAAHAHIHKPFYANRPHLVPDEIYSELSKDQQAALAGFSTALFVAVNKLGPDSVSVVDALLHLHCYFATQCDAHPSFPIFADNILTQARTHCERILPHADSVSASSSSVGSPLSQSHASVQPSPYGANASAALTRAPGPVLGTAPGQSPKLPVHFGWSGTRIPLINVLLQSPQISMRTRALKLAERYLPSDEFLLARTLLALAESMTTVDPVMSEGLYRSSIKHLERNPQTAEARIAWVDANVGYAYLLSLMSWNGKPRSVDAHRVLTKVESVLAEHPWLRPRRRQYSMRGAFPYKDQLDSVDAYSKPGAGSGEHQTPRIALRSVSVRSMVGQGTIESSATSSSSGHESLISTSKSARLSDSESEAGPRSDTETVIGPDSEPPKDWVVWGEPSTNPLDYWVVERYTI